MTATWSALFRKECGAVAVETAAVLGLMVVLLIGLLDCLMTLSVIEGMESAAASAERTLALPGNDIAAVEAAAGAAMFWYARDCIEIVPDSSLTAPVQAWTMQCRFSSLTGFVSGLLGDGISFRATLVAPQLGGGP